MQARIPAAIPMVAHRTKLIQLPDRQDISGIFIPIHYGLLNVCRQSFPRRGNWFYLREIRSVLWNKGNALSEESTRKELACLRGDIESIAGAPGDSVRRSITEVMTMDDGNHFTEWISPET
ncbi:uncharacterized protein N7469_004580 [Penicillium citrinum]|uniref:Uncharacterized protein n=1 Tax=Penicillium citrinum TaxID=5077 RepID=A0A9W9P4X9_PENCI|nr:uncharacterized protein N7469_004580 [Penicillium citrinum]KAJ5235412.1 hypothetical protein N7469_004580 [Penicillium citrinum]